MTVVTFVYLQQVPPSFLDVVTKIWPPCLIKTRTVTSVSHNSCGVFATPGPISSSNSKNYTITLFSERPIPPKTQKWMQKISKQLTIFIDHRRKGDSLWLTKFLKSIGNKILKKEFGGSLKLKFRSLFIRIKRNTSRKRVSLIYWERVTTLVSEMHLRVPVETQQFRKVDLYWTCLFLFTREWNGTFVNRSDFWFTFPYHPNFGLTLDQSAGFFPYPCVNATSLPTGFWNGPERTSMQSYPWPCERGPTEMHKICIWPIE